MGDAPATASETSGAIPDDLVHWVDLQVTAEHSDGTAFDAAGSGSAFRPGERMVRQTRSLSSTRTSHRCRPWRTSSHRWSVSAITAPCSASAIAHTWCEPMPFPASGEDDGGGLGGGFFTAGDASDDTTAAWLTITVRAPDHEPTVARRVLFDRYDAEDRAQGSLDPAAVPALELVNMGEELGDQVLPVQQVTWLSLATGIPSRTSPVLKLDDDDSRAPCCCGVRTAACRLHCWVSLATGARRPHVQQWRQCHGPHGGRGSRRGAAL